MAQEAMSSDEVAKIANPDAKDHYEGECLKRIPDV
jgi:hypothetical protein